ncbi:Di-glucose binding protein with Kinesin motor domain, putative [Theobroma cacao]|uniref:Kinesin-like protein n=1 Tax=Theobroma cacao TaxID=3641 RepID=A0A061FHA7_THECC|nr:Di-glucose binding protein with Kinesin motor domain, putative [Theobroma cacao]
MLGFSLSLPDLVVCTGSPDIPIEFSLENGIDGSDTKVKHKTPTAKFSTVCQTFHKEMPPDSSFVLLPLPGTADYVHKEHEHLPVISINARCINGAVELDGVIYSDGGCYVGGDVIRTDSVVGDGVGNSLYNTAQFGDFSYKFSSLESGFYNVDLLFAEIVFTTGPPGIRVFDVFIQQEKVGAHKPLVISNIKTFVDSGRGLLIRFEGLMRCPIVCGITVRKDSRAKKLQRDYERQSKEIAEMRRAFEGLKRENQLKSKECREACKSLQELQSELMRKSMHVGSLALATEGEVKEKSRWFSSLRDMTRNLKIMKMEHIKLSEEASMYNYCFKDINEIGSSILSRINQQADLHEDLKINFLRGAKERKELYNKVLELKDGELTVLSNGAPRKIFKFDAVFGPQADQADVFQDTAPFATSVLDGYNVCVFAYGQTGIGKTFTALSKARCQKRLEIRQVGEGMDHVPGLVEAHVKNMNEVWEVLQTGSNARAVGSTNANEHRSRSHCIHCVMVKGENLLNGECTKSKLWLVDLAGSERVAKPEVHGERLKETQNINRSLSALGNVISARATKSPHIPSRL